ncbi:MAG: succinate-semialdehyde dehydrogenase (NADP(+)), partial [Pseudomonadota bacterium]
MLDTATNLKSILNDPDLLAESAYAAGDWVTGDNGVFEVMNPARGDVIAEVADMSRAQVAATIDAAY